MPTKPKTYVASTAQGARKRLGLSPDDVAEAMQEHGHNWKPGTVVNVENDRKEKWSLAEMVHYAETLKLDVHDLFPLDKVASGELGRAGLMETIVVGTAVAAALISNKRSTTSDALVHPLPQRDTEPTLPTRAEAA